MRMVANGLLILMVGGFILLWFWEFGKQLSTGKNRPRKTEQKTKGNLKKAAFIFGTALLFRIAVFLCGYVLFAMLSDGAGLHLADYLSYWNRWDGPHYIDIAKNGYQNCIENGQHLFLVFFPLYPWCIKIFQFYLGDYVLAAIVISFLAYATGVLFLYRTLTDEYGEEIATKTLVLLSTSPFAFFFGAVMTESLFFCLLSIEFYLIKKHKWFLAGIFGIGCSLCRAQGVIVLGVGAVEFLTWYPPIALFREKRGREFVKALFTEAIFLLLTPLGTLLYLFINYRVEGNCFQFVIYQKEHWHLGPTFFTNTISEILSYLFHPETPLVNIISIWLPEFLVFFFSFAALYYARKRHPLKYTAFLFVYLMINFSVTWLVSGSRYMLCALPLYVIVGEFLHRHKKAYPVVIAIDSMLMMVYLMGFFLWKPVM